MEHLVELPLINLGTASLGHVWNSKDFLVKEGISLDLGLLGGLLLSLHRIDLEAVEATEIRSSSSSEVDSSSSSSPSLLPLVVASKRWLLSQWPLKKRQPRGEFHQLSFLGERNFLAKYFILLTLLACYSVQQSEQQRHCLEIKSKRVKREELKQDRCKKIEMIY